MNNIPENEEILRPSLSHLPDSYGQWLLSPEKTYEMIDR